MGADPEKAKAATSHEVPRHENPSSQAGSGSVTKSDPKATKSESEEQKLDAELAHLPQSERDVLKEQLLIENTKVTYFTLYRYATRNDIIALVVCSIAALAAGAALPLFTVCVGYIYIPMLF